MRILFTVSYYTPYISGLTLYIARLARYFAQQKHDSYVLTNQHSPKLLQKEVIDGVHVSRVKPLFQLSKGFISWEWLVKSINEVRHADIVILDLPQFEAVVPLIIAKIYKVPTIALYQCDVKLPQGLFNKLTEAVLIISHFITLHLSDCIITHTKDFAVNSPLLSRFLSKIEYVYPPTLTFKLNKRVLNIFKRKIKLSNGYVIGVAARLASEKGIEYLLEAIPFLKTRLGGVSFKVVIAGPTDPVGEQLYKYTILQLIQKYKDYVVLLGEVPTPGMGSFYGLSDVLVVPSINSTDSIATVQLEAMVAGIPVVATNLPGIRIPVQKTGMGKIVPAKNSKALASAISDVLLHNQYYRKKRVIAQREFSLDKTVQYYELLLKRLVL